MKKPVLITCYVNPDLDGVACVLAYAEFLSKSGKNVVTGIIGEPHDEVKYLLQRFSIQYPAAILNADDYDEVMLVDSSELNGLEGKVAPEKAIEIIDHRKGHEADKFPQAKVQIELVGAAATLIAEKFINNHIAISQQSAILLCGAIISNTLNFKGSVTTERDKQAVVWLNTTAQLPENFWQELFLAKSELSGHKLRDRIQQDFAWFIMGDKKLGIAQIEMIGVKKLLEDRETEIIEILREMESEMDLDYIFQNTLELQEGRNYFVTHHESTKRLLEKILPITFFEDVAEYRELIMRKQIVPLLKKELENQGL
jgi:manganese-dependent inorganic pyrophosphatase